MTDKTDKPDKPDDYELIAAEDLEDLIEFFTPMKPAERIAKIRAVGERALAEVESESDIKTLVLSLGGMTTSLLDGLKGSGDYVNAAAVHPLLIVLLRLAELSGVEQEDGSADWKTSRKTLADNMLMLGLMGLKGHAQKAGKWDVALEYARQLQTITTELGDDEAQELVAAMIGTLEYRVARMKKKQADAPAVEKAIRATEDIVMAEVGEAEQVGTISATKEG